MKWFFPIVLFGLLFIQAVPVQAQDAAPKSSEKFEFGWGPGILARQDLLLSPMSTVNAGLLNLNTRFTREKRKIFIVEASLAAYRPARFDAHDYWFDPGSDTLQTQRHYFFSAEVRLSRGLFSRPLSDRIRWGVDAGFTSTIQSVSFLTAAFGTFNYTSIFSAEPVIWAEATTDKGKRLRASLCLPLLSWVARSPYLLNDDAFIENAASHNGFKTFFALLGDGNLQTLNSFQRATLSLQASMPVNDWCSLGAEYKLDFIHLRKPLPLFSYLHSLHFTAAFQF